LREPGRCPNFFILELAGKRTEDARFAETHMK
jgi:hypothetical protein